MRRYLCKISFSPWPHLMSDIFSIEPRSKKWPKSYRSKGLPGGGGGGGGQIRARGIRGNGGWRPNPGSQSGFVSAPTIEEWKFEHWSPPQTFLYDPCIDQLWQVVAMHHRLIDHWLISPILTSTSCRTQAHRACPRLNPCCVLVEHVGCKVGWSVIVRWCKNETKTDMCYIYLK